MNKKFNVLGVVCAVLVPSLGIAALELPHLFKKGDVIKAAEVNENFEALRAHLEEVEAASAPLPVIQLSLPGTQVDTGGAASKVATCNLTQTSLSVGSWPAVVAGEQDFPSAGLYRAHLEMAGDPSYFRINGDTNGYISPNFAADQGFTSSEFLMRVEDPAAGFEVTVSTGDCASGRVILSRVRE